MRAIIHTHSRRPRKPYSCPARNAHQLRAPACTHHSGRPGVGVQNGCLGPDCAGPHSRQLAAKQGRVQGSTRLLRVLPWGHKCTTTRRYPGAESCTMHRSAQPPLVPGPSRAALPWQASETHLSAAPRECPAATMRCGWVPPLRPSSTAVMFSWSAHRLWEEASGGTMDHVHASKMKCCASSQQPTASRGHRPSCLPATPRIPDTAAASEPCCPPDLGLVVNESCWFRKPLCTCSRAGQDTLQPGAGAADAFDRQLNPYLRLTRS